MKVGVKISVGVQGWGQVSHLPLLLRLSLVEPLQ